MSQEELKQEKLEETVSEKPEEDINSLLPDGEKINKPAADAPSYDVVIEDARLAFMKKYKAGRRNSYIAMGAVMALAIASVIFITVNIFALKIVGWCLVGVALVGMLIYYIVTRNNLPNATREYINIVNQQFNSRNFSDTRFSDVSTDKNEKFELSDPVSDSIFNNLNNIASRNIINGKFDGRSFKAGDLGLYSGAGKARTSAFVGKYLRYPNDLHFEGRYILVSKSKTPVDQPSMIDDLTALYDNDNFVIYGKVGANFKNDLGQKFIDKIKDIKVENHLLNVSVVVWGGSSSLYASYDDSIMSLPYQDVYKKEPNEQFAKNLVQFFDALSLIAKKEK